MGRSRMKISEEALKDDFIYGPAMDKILVEAAMLEAQGSLNRLLVKAEL